MKKVLLGTALSLIVSTAVTAGEEDYNNTNNGTPIALILNHGNSEALYAGLEADLFTYNSSSYIPSEFQKVSTSNKSNTLVNTIFWDSFNYPTND